MNPIKTYLYKALTVLPFTFLFAPVFYPFLNYKPNPDLIFLNSAFPFLVYLFYAFFIYFAMCIALIFKKYKLLAYPIIITAAFFARYIAALPALDFHRMHVFADEFGEAYFIHVPISTGEFSELSYLMMILFITAAIAGCFTAAYTKKNATDFMRRGNTFLFLHLAVLGGLFHGNAIYLSLFAATYFIARNFILINRELEIYSEKGAYNTSGVRRIVAYYFYMTALFMVVPVIICAVIVPFIVERIRLLISAILRIIINAVVEYERDLPDLEEVELPEAMQDSSFLRENVNEQLDMIVYYILFVIFIIIIFIFRKWFLKIFKELIALLRTKIKLGEYDKNKVINQEIITELPKEKIKKGRAAYKNYLKKLHAIPDMSQRFLFAYNCLHWELVKKDAELKESLTPHELTAVVAGRDNSGAPYQELSNVKDLYEDIKYGRIAQNHDLLRDMTARAELLLKQVLS